VCYYANKCGSFVIQNCSEPEFFSIQNDLHFSELFFRYISKYTLPASTTRLLMLSVMIKLKWKVKPVSGVLYDLL